MVLSVIDSKVDFNGRFGHFNTGVEINCTTWCMGVSPPVDLKVE